MIPPINTSLLELFRIGPGPSSSHTIGPMRAARDFLHAVRALPEATKSRAARLEVRLYGSLAATGPGHGTNRAVLAGLLDQAPETCTPEFLQGVNLAPDAPHELDLGGRGFVMHSSDVVLDFAEQGFSHGNTLVPRLLDEQGRPLLERRYASVGGGFIQWEGQPEERRGEPVFPFFDMRSLKLALNESSLPLHELMLMNEAALTGRGQGEILADLDRIMDVMDAAVQRGLSARGKLPGLGLARKAHILLARASAADSGAGRFLLHLDAYAFAAAEENAAGGIVATAPTSGSSGVIPAVLALLRRHQLRDRDTLRRGIIAAGTIGLLVRHNASIAGAEVGCQGEIGAASCMAAALLAYASDLPIWAVETAAEIALEHHLGLTCDPVGGFVQIPCIERNAMGAVKAYNAFLIASVEDQGLNVMGLDGVIRAMLETGRDMSAKYKETATGGLALSRPAC
nr:L-serine ammonia-lyase [Desulfovibrio aminophilus]